MSKNRTLAELETSAAEHKATKDKLAKIEATRDRRIVRAVSLGIDKAAAARHAGLTRQRVGQIVDAAAAAGEL